MLLAYHLKYRLVTFDLREYNQGINSKVNRIIILCQFDIRKLVQSYFEHFGMTNENTKKMDNIIMAVISEKGLISMCAGKQNGCFHGPAHR